MNRRQKRTKSSFFVLLYPFSGLPRLLLYIKSQISGVRQTGALLSTALHLGVLLDVLPLFSNILLYMFLYFSAFSFIIWTLWPTEYYYHHLSIVLSFYLFYCSQLLERIFLTFFHKISPYTVVVYYSYQLIASHHPLKYVIMEMIYYYLKVGKYVYYDFLWGPASTCWSLGKNICVFWREP